MTRSVNPVLYVTFRCATYPRLARLVGFSFSRDFYICLRHSSASTTHTRRRTYNRESDSINIIGCAGLQRARSIINTRFVYIYIYSITKTIISQRRFNRVLRPSDRIDIRFQFVEQFMRHAIESIMSTDGGNTSNRPPVEMVPNVSTNLPFCFLGDRRFQIRNFLVRPKVNAKKNIRNTKPDK